MRITPYYLFMIYDLNNVTLHNVRKYLGSISAA